jgi:hypothetical protein
MNTFSSYYSLLSSFFSSFLLLTCFLFITQMFEHAVRNDFKSYTLMSSLKNCKKSESNTSPYSNLEFNDFIILLFEYSFYTESCFNSSNASSDTVLLDGVYLSNFFFVVVLYLVSSGVM